jgi:hypothetical protein
LQSSHARAEVVPEGGGNVVRAVCKVIVEARPTLDPELDEKAEEATEYLSTDVSLNVRSRRVPPLPPLPPTTSNAECVDLQAKFDRVLKVVKEQAAKKQAPDLAMISAFLNTAVKPMPPDGTPGGCGKCVWSREGGAFDGVIVSSKEFNMNHMHFGACDDYTHGTSAQQLYMRVKAEFPNGIAKDLKAFALAYMDTLGAVMLGKSEEEKAYEEGRNPVESKRKSENGVALYQYPSGSGQRERGGRVDVHGALCDTKKTPHHHRVFQGYQMPPAAGASRKRPMPETAVDSDNGSSDSD